MLTRHAMLRFRYVSFFDTQAASYATRHVDVITLIVIFFAADI